MPDAEEEGVEKGRLEEGNVEAEMVKIRCGAVNEALFGIHPACIPETKADRHSRACRWS